MRLSQQRQKRSLKIILPLAAIAIALISYGVYAYSTSVWPFNTDQSVVDDTATSEPNINKPTSKEELDEKEEFSKDGPNTTTDGTGVVDSNGSSAEPTSSGVSSSSGNITLHSPSQGETLSSNLTVRGSAKVNSVHYRIKDNVNGVIGQGELTVVNGTFGGELRIHTEASSGTFEIYSLDQQGREINHVEVNVKY